MRGWSARVVRVVVIMLVFAILGACRSKSSASRHEDEQAAGSSRSTLAQLFLPSATFAATHTSSGGVSLADIAEQSVAGVVNVSSSRVIRTEVSPFFQDPFFRRFFGEGGLLPGVPEMQHQRSLGSGVIVRADGIVLTNYHVIESAETIRVVMQGRQEEFEAKVVGTDPKTDLAVIRLQGKPGNLKVLPLGDSGRMRLGDVVLAIGDPFGVGKTVTMGIVSAKGRANVGLADYEDFIQTDAAINPGNSGGALVNMAGEVIGINTAILSRSGGYQGIGFAIPSNMARPVMESLLKSGKVHRGWLGVVVQDVTPALAKALGLSATAGVLVSDVIKDTPAAKAGLQRGDLVLKIDGHPVTSSSQFRTLVASHAPGAKIHLEVERKGKSLKLPVTLSTLPAPAVTQLNSRQGILGGVSVQELNDDTRRTYRLPTNLKQGAVVTGVVPNSPAADAGLRPGDVILEINHAAVDSIQKFEQLYKASSRQVLLLVYRNGMTSYVLLTR